mmetsp:Transcript_34083/g.87910  ORF Transcript_34083/g.87910 Transcript_34083/m.87910 type:complete len:128 (-) Transcript_34083:1067-1450(-)|eukprot:CAMPEP_0113898656 /NCGR_PEP_ID=MMETSP0780_2-20120614/19535_1 /TAXON_ID=652834 /ORGANISM="Palpitomonas bilix" /LENGTH=127 /DNA_ID=CAMNT_0000890613 /DNA_START=171 /DNA_END=554 /DNA_ORIENTATION=- /assembly_acc=CAM_ASM_000599
MAMHNSFAEDAKGLMALSVPLGVVDGVVRAYGFLRTAEGSIASQSSAWKAGFALGQGVQGAAIVSGYSVVYLGLRRGLQQSFDLDRTSAAVASGTTSVALLYRMAPSARPLLPLAVAVSVFDALLRS